MAQRHPPPKHAGANPNWLTDPDIRASLTKLVTGETTCEVCAIVVALPAGPRLVALRSVNRSPTSFSIPESEWRRVNQWITNHGGTALCLIHSHPGNGAGAILSPSESDIQNMAQSPNLPWVIVTRNGNEIAFSEYDPPRAPES